MLAVTDMRNFRLGKVELILSLCVTCGVAQVKFLRCVCGHTCNEFELLS